MTVEERMIICCEIQAEMITILDVLEVGHISKAEESARKAKKRALDLLNDLRLERQLSEKKASPVPR